MDGREPQTERIQENEKRGPYWEGALRRASVLPVPLLGVSGEGGLAPGPDSAPSGGLFVKSAMAARCQKQCWVLSPGGVSHGPRFEEAALSPHFLPLCPLPVFRMPRQVVEAHGEAGHGLCPQSLLRDPRKQCRSFGDLEPGIICHGNWWR